MTFHPPRYPQDPTESAGHCNGWKFTGNFAQIAAPQPIGLWKRPIPARATLVPRPNSHLRERYFVADPGDETQGPRRRNHFRARERRPEIGRASWRERERGSVG